MKFAVDREKIDGWLKTLALAIGLIAAVIFGVKHYTKFDTEQKMIASLAGDTTLEIDGGKGVIFPAHGREYCRVSGSYKVRNSGAYGFYSESVAIALWELPLLDDEIKTEQPVAISVQDRLDNRDSQFPAIPIADQVIDVGENFAPDNELQRSFLFIFPIERDGQPDRNRFDSYYLVDANARAALKPEVLADGGKRIARYCPDGEKSGLRVFADFFARIGDPGVCFNRNDLRHTSHTFLCADPDPKPAKQ